MFEVKKTRPKLAIVARVSRELAIAFALGGVPVLLNSESSAQFKAMLDLLLAAPILIGYYAWLCLAFAVVQLLNTGGGSCPLGISAGSTLCIFF